MTSRSLYGWFATSLASHPHAVALEIGTTALTYAELDRAAAWMAERICAAAAGVPSRVGLLTSRGLPGYVAYVAALRLGATVVPLNPAAPPIRNYAIIDEAAVDITVVDATSGALTEVHEGPRGPRLLDMTGFDLAEVPARMPGPRTPGVTRAAAKDLAYIIFTSGTTGSPKGVPIRNESISAYLEHAIDRYALGPGCRTSQMFEMSFDASLLEIFGTWGSGATLCVPEPADVFTPVRYANARKLTHWMSVPSIISFARQFRALTPGSMPTVRCAVFGGETLTVDQAEAWCAAAPNATVHNTYGPTELTVFVTDYQLPQDRSRWPRSSNGSVPLGPMFPGAEWILLDDDQRPVPSDGELCIRGVQRFDGYLNAAQNSGRFVAVRAVDGAQDDGTAETVADSAYYRTGDRCCLEDGALIHLGRIDDQVKIRGHRIELGEIESVLRGHPEVVAVVVVAVTADDGEIELHGVYTGKEIPGAEFAHLLSVLPAYMRPREIRHRESIPLTPVGKVDRRHLASELGTPLR
ncbi:AMP-binding protein [Symbioplanes lichenis]|uniref:AMP-binding protein n=1 Tax=Symbioplanes lichenis TaxID=1629072 RepID=UPI0027390BFF|nr:AMP-binding protein [Actinoplanes lichenis]